MSAFDFLLACLATWRVAALLVREDGPYDVLARLRRGLGRSMPGRALECFFCTSLWVAAPAALWLVGISRRWPVVWLAVSGAAGLLERLTAPAEVPRVLELSEAAALMEEGRG